MWERNCWVARWTFGQPSWRMANSIPKGFDQFTLPPATSESSARSPPTLGIVFLFHSSCSDGCVLTSHHVFNWLPFVFYSSFPSLLWSSWALPGLFIFHYHHLPLPLLASQNSFLTIRCLDLQENSVSPFITLLRKNFSCSNFELPLNTCCRRIHACLLTVWLFCLCLKITAGTNTKSQSKMLAVTNW